MKKFSIVLIIFLLCFGVACRRLPDPELNQNKPGFGYSERWKCFEDRFKRSDISDEDDPVFLSMYFFWFTGAYNEVYTREKKTFWVNSITEDFVAKINKLYASDEQKYSFLEPFRECLKLLDKDHEVTDEELEDYKVVILYAIDYYEGEDDNMGQYNNQEP